MLYALSHSLARGRNAGFASAFGLATGNTLHVCLNAFGFSYLLVKYPLLLNIIKLAGAIYLFYLGIVYIINSKKSFNPSFSQENSSDKSLISLYKKGILVEFLNPKTALFYISVLPQFVNTDKGSVVAQMIILGLCVPITALFVDLSVSFFADAIKNKVMSGRFKNKYHEVFSGMLLIVLSITVIIL